MSHGVRRPSLHAIAQDLQARQLQARNALTGTPVSALPGQGAMVKKGWPGPTAIRHGVGAGVGGGPRMARGRR